VMFSNACGPVLCMLFICSEELKCAERDWDVLHEE